MKTRWRPLILLTALTALILGLPACSSDGDSDPMDPDGGGGEVDTTPPTVTLITPEDGTLAVESWSSIFITFDEPMDTSVVPATQIQLSQGALELAEWMDDFSLMVTLGEIPQAAQITLTLGTGFLDAAGNALAAPHSVTYWTWSQTLAVLEHTPANGAVDVNRAASVELLFSTDVVAGSLAAGVTISDPAKAPLAFGVETLSPFRFRLLPDTPLPATSGITVTVGTQVQSSAGPLTEPYVFAFTTGETIDATPPTILSIDPPSGATIPTDQATLTITFDEPIETMDFAPTFLNGQFAWLLGQAAQPPGFDVDQRVLTVHLPADLPAGLPLEARFGGYVDVNGNVQDQETVWTATIAGTADPYPVWDGRRWAAGGDWSEGALGNGTPTGSGYDLVRYEFTARGTAGQWDRREYYDAWQTLDYYEIQSVSAAGMNLLGIAESEDGFTERMASTPLTFFRFPLTQGNQWSGSATVTFPDGTITVDGTGMVVGQEDLAYAYDGFEIVWTDVWKVTLEVDLSVGATPIGTDLTHYWIAPGVGVIREDYREENVDEGYWYESDKWLQIDLE